jgi:AcrR family transcriptional regulator
VGRCEPTRCLHSESITARRTNNGPLRRQTLADAAIEVLGTQGVRGLSHPRVDKHAGMPAGTTSYYFRTRKALWQAVADRVNALDTADLTLMSELAHSDDAGYSGTLGLARLVILSGTEPWLTRSRARQELALAGRYDADLEATLLGYVRHFYGLVREIIAQWHPPAEPPEAELLNEQATMVMTFIYGVMTSFVHGYPVIDDADHLDQQIQGVLHAVKTAHQKKARPPRVT